MALLLWYQYFSNHYHYQWKRPISIPQQKVILLHCCSFSLCALKQPNTLHAYHKSAVLITAYLIKQFERHFTCVLSSWKPSRKLSSSSSALSILSAYSPTIQIMAARASGSSRESRFSHRVAITLSYLTNDIAGGKAGFSESLLNSSTFYNERHGWTETVSGQWTSNIWIMNLSQTEIGCSLEREREKQLYWQKRSGTGETAQETEKPTCWGTCGRCPWWPQWLPAPHNWPWSEWGQAVCWHNALLIAVTKTGGTEKQIMY